MYGMLFFSYCIDSFLVTMSKWSRHPIQNANIPSLNRALVKKTHWHWCPHIVNLFQLYFFTKGKQNKSSKEKQLLLQEYVQFLLKKREKEKVKKEKILHLLPTVLLYRCTFLRIYEPLSQYLHPSYPLPITNWQLWKKCSGNVEPPGPEGGELSSL